MRDSWRVLVASAVLLTLVGLPGRARAVPPDRVGQIVIEGNTATPQWFILAHAPFHPGQVLRYPDLEKAQERLAATGLFRADRPPTVEVAPNGPDAGLKDIRIRIAERPCNRLIWSGVEIVTLCLDGRMSELVRRTIVRSVPR